MPESPDTKRQPDLVELAPGVHVPVEFEQTIWMAGNVGCWRVRVRIGDDHTPHLVSFTSQWIDDPPKVSDLGEPQRRISELAVARQALRTATDRMMEDAGASWAVTPGMLAEFGGELPLKAGGLLLDAAELDRIERDAVAAVRPRPGRPPVENDLKARALKVYRDQGIEAAMRAVDRKERTVRRWIADAKKEEGN